MDPFHIDGHPDAQSVAAEVIPRIHSDIDSFRMPKYGKKLHPFALESISQWITDGMPESFGKVDGMALQDVAFFVSLNLSDDPSQPTIDLFSSHFVMGHRDSKIRDRFRCPLCHEYQSGDTAASEVLQGPDSARSIWRAKCRVGGVGALIKTGTETKLLNNNV